MDIGIIGAGRIGGSLTRLLTGLGHAVRVSNSRAPETLADLVAETGAASVWAAEAAADADLVIMSIPQRNVVDLTLGILSTAGSGAPLIETRADARQRWADRAPGGRRRPGRQADRLGPG